MPSTLNMGHMWRGFLKERGQSALDFSDKGLEQVWSSEQSDKNISDRRTQLQEDCDAAESVLKKVRFQIFQYAMN